MPCSVKAMADVINHLYNLGYVEILDIDVGARDIYITARYNKSCDPECFKLTEILREIDASYHA